MTVDRMAESLRGTGRGAPVVDLVAPAAATSADEPADALAALLHTPDDGELTAEEKAKIVALEKAKRERTAHKDSYDALGPDIKRMEAELIELAAERQLYDKRGRIMLPDVEDGQGFELHPYDRKMIWPKYRDNPDTDQPFGQEDLIEALRECDLGHLVVERADSDAYNKYVRDRVKRWRRKCGETGVTDGQGRYLDLDGEPITAEEAEDPTADLLALPARLRTVAEPVEATSILFSRREVASRALAAVDAAEEAAELAADGG